MVMEVMGRLAIPSVLWGGLCIYFANSRSSAKEQTYGLQTLQAWTFERLGWPFPRKVSVVTPNGAQRVYENADVPHLGWMRPYAQAYVHHLSLAFWLWIIGVGLILLIATRWFIDSGEDKLKARYIRGQVAIPLRDLIRQIEVFNVGEVRRRKDRDYRPVALVGVPFPYATEREHTLAVGSPGSGKSQAIHRLLESLRARGDRAVVYDPELEYTKHHFDAATDVLLNPYDARSVAWSPYNDARELPDFDKLAACLFKDPRSGDPYWTRATRQIFTYAAYQLRRQYPQATLEDLLMVFFGPLRVLAKLVEGTPAASHLAGGSNGRTDSLRSVLADGANSLVHLAGGAADFSIRDWVNAPAGRGGILFMSAPETHMTSLRPLLSFWSELVVSSLLARVNDAEIQTTWIILDEFPSLGKVESLASGPERLRKYGGAVVLGMQQVSQIQEIYGHEVAQTIIGQCATKLILRCQDPETAKHMAEQLGRRQTRRVDETVSYGANSLRDGVGLTPREELELVALPDEVMNLPKFHGFIRVSNARESAPFPISTVRFEYRARPRRAEGLMPIGGPSPVDSFFSLLGEGTASERVDPGEESGFMRASPQAGAASMPNADGLSGSGEDDVAQEAAGSSEGGAAIQASDRPARRPRADEADRASAAAAFQSPTYVPGVIRDPAEAIARRLHEAANEQPRAFALLVERTRRESLENIPLSGLAVWRKPRNEREADQASGSLLQEQGSEPNLDGGPAFDPFSGR
jgi:type IV conjugative transfer system coupling protein TraD